MNDENAIFQSSSLSPNMEDYMEAIVVLSEKHRVVRVKDIAQSLNIKMPSVTAALNKLKDQKLIDYEKYGFVELTEKGKEIAERIYFRHRSLMEFFSDVLMLEAEMAEMQACKVEHLLSPEAFLKLYNLLKFVKTEREAGREWTRRIDELMRSL
ncbi:MAG: metal-dependent transcriptional regulator [Spirochaetes bacterium]|nr:metal-dependent transcriptional regulator [Spirochaetota bacterium]